MGRSLVPCAVTFSKFRGPHDGNLNLGLQTKHRRGIGSLVLVLVGGCSGSGGFVFRATTHVGLLLLLVAVVQRVLLRTGRVAVVVTRGTAAFGLFGRLGTSSSTRGSLAV